MSKFYSIQIGAIFLTKDGTNGSLPCKLEIENVEDLTVSVTGVSITTASGERVRQMVEWTGGKEFSIKISTLTADLYDDLKTMLNAANGANTSFTVAGTGASGDFSVTAKPSLQKPFTCAGFREGRIKDVVLKFETV